MTGKPFFDTTILIYSISHEDKRAITAERLLLHGGYVSVQVLNEFTAVARRKLGMSWDETRQALSAIRTLCNSPVALTLSTHEKAFDIAVRYGYYIYDAVILAAALQAGCKTLYSEDMQHDQWIETISIINPFA